MSSLFRPLYESMLPQALESRPVEDQRQYMVVVSLILISSFFLIVLGVITALQGESVLPILDFGIAAMFMGMGIFLRKTGKIKEVSTVIVSCIAVYFYYLFHYGGVERSTWVWYFSFPLWAIFILGKRRGTTLTLLLLLVTLVTYTFVVTATDNKFYSMNMMLRFTMAYLCITFITYIMEDTRIITYRRMIASNAELHETIQELHQTKGQLHEMTTRDHLTGLYNYKYFIDILKLSLAHANRYDGPMALMLIEIDYSENYAARYGDASYGRMVKQIADLVSNLVENETDSLCHIASAEFALILNNTRPEQVDQIAVAIRQRISDCNYTHDRSPFKHLTVSVGSINIPRGHDVMECEKVIDLAKQSLGRAVQKGRNSTSTSLMVISQNSDE